MLLIDLGNTRGKLVMVAKGQLLQPVYWDYDHDIAALFAKLNPSTICMASVAPLPIERRLMDAAVAAGIPLKRVATEPANFGVVNGYADYHQMGIDRWLALVAARQVTEQACVVVDAGTAVTIDAMNEAGSHVGGWIVPGLTLMRASLMQRSEKLNVAASQFKVGFGVTTSDAMSRGALHAVSGAVAQACSLLAKVSRVNPTVLLTGGDAEALAPALTGNVQIIPDLVFKGLHCYAEAI
ncbi:type III pantothenate kinase [Neiella sp. HB171785]|uniref:Type III pantothenate kinase n=1 Tax=Neiella litorisoli TaxID=2771431 RepID=A0A8J6QRS4_9GAMM|nr:type III pantothenate kinase [Neiella litorisoli]MBD1390516.1 type III pantothenate kinase [Neiella litorisoli]